MLDDDVDRLRRIAPDALTPASDSELCDQHVTRYVSEDALRTTPDGDCVPLDGDGRCRHNADGPAIGRVYLSTLHREPGADSRVDWRQLADLG